MKSRTAPATIHDIAREAGVSLTTVSHVLSGKRPVSKALRERVQAAIARLGYTPNVLAQRLATQQRARTIGISLHGGPRHLANPVFAEILAGVADVAEAQRYQLLISTAAKADGQLVAQFARDGSVAGLLLFEVLLDDPRVAALEHSDLPFVLVGRRADTAPALPSVDADTEAGVGEATAHLLELGHRRIALTVAPQSLGFAARAVQGYGQALAARGLPVDPALILECVSEAPRYYAAVSRLLRAERFTAALVMNGGMVDVATQAIRDAGLQVPGDISLVGHSALWSELPGSAGRTNLRIPARALGGEGARMLLALLAGEPLAAQQVLLPYTLSVPSGEAFTPQSSS
jgi:DNA-binding LacI/PurR family transcriptional regulator